MNRFSSIFKSTKMAMEQRVGKKRVTGLKKGEPGNIEIGLPGSLKHPKTMIRS